MVFMIADNKLTSFLSPLNVLSGALFQYHVINECNADGISIDIFFF